VVLTGYNTDIEYSGTVYHVQTEDKGQNNPLVESLVYTAGEILYTRRTPYHDLIAEEVDKGAVATLMERQHRTIVQAVQAGGVDRLTGTIAVASPDDTTISSKEAKRAAPTGNESSLDQVILDYLEAQRERAHLILRAGSEHQFHHDRPATVTVIGEDSTAHDPVSGVTVSVLYKSTTEPRRLVLAEGETDNAGRFTAEVKLPAFSGGTSAVVIIAESGLGQSEMKYIVHR
jgi:hypothetical protein